MLFKKTVVTIHVMEGTLEKNGAVSEIGLNQVESFVSLFAVSEVFARDQSFCHTQERWRKS